MKAKLALRSPFRSLRQFWMAFALVVALPGLLFGVALAWWSARDLVRDLERDADRLAMAAAEGMASHLKTMAAFTEVLSRLPLEKDNYEHFYQLAKNFSRHVGYHVTLADAEGRQFLSTRLPFGEAPPRRLALDSVKRAAASGQPEVSDLFMGRMAGRYVVAVDTPVRSQEGLRIITLSCDVEMLADVLTRTVAPEGWILGLIDGRGNIIARTRDPEEWVGRKARPDLVAASRRADHGSIHDVSLEGIPLFNVFHRVPGTDWTVVVGIPEASLYAPLVWPLGELAAALALVIGLTALLAWLFTRQLNTATGRLMAVAREPSAEVEPAGHGNSFAEFEEVVHGLRSVAAKRQELVSALDLSVSLIRDLDGTIRHWTSGCQQLYGWTAAEAVGRSGHELLKTEFPEPIAGIEARLGEVGEWIGELRHSRKNGEVLRISAHWKVHVMAAGQVVVETLHDISAETRLELALRESQAHFRATFEQVGVGVCHATVDGRFLRVNDKYCAIVGRGREELLGLRFQDITYPEDIQPNLAGRTQLLAGTIPSYSMEKRYLRPDGTVVWINLTIALVRTVAGEPDYFLTVVEDIQGRKEMERALAEERETRHRILEQQVAERTAELLAANRQLEAFLYAASHDLKGPLGRISSFSTLLERNYRDRLEGDGLAFLDFIRDNAGRLTRLIDDLLTHARIDQQAPRLQPVDLAASVQAVLQARADDCREAGMVVRLALPAVQVLADPYGLNQALQNLLENAIKYSAETVEPTVEIGGEEVAGRFRLWVRDNGIGFDMGYHDRIFEIFRRLHSYAEYAGNGVGLALVKRAMERMGGTVWAESEPGRGATFYLEFELAAVAAAA